MSGTGEGAERVERAEGAVRERFHRGLDQVATGFAPVEAAMRQGRGIRVRRRAAVGGSVALALAVVGVAFAASGTGTPMPIVPPVVPPGVPSAIHPSAHKLSESPGGLAEARLASGVADGVPWTVTEEAAPGAECAFVTQGPSYHNSYPFGIQGPSDAPGLDYTALTCSELSAPAKDPVALTTPMAIIFGAVPLEYGALRPDVTSLDVGFGDGEQLHLVPVIVDGTAYIVFPKPPDLAIARLTAHSPRGDQFTVPDNEAAGFGIGTWYGPGQTAPTEVATETVPGVSAVPQSWSVVVRVGPWGRCLVASGIFTTPPSCEPAGEPATIGLAGVTSFDGSQAFGLFYGDLDPVVARVDFLGKTGNLVAAGRLTTRDGHLYCAVAVPLGTTVEAVFYDASGKVLQTERLPIPGP